MNLHKLDFRKAFDTSNLFYILTLRQVWIYNVHKNNQIKKSIWHLTFFLLKNMNLQLLDNGKAFNRLY